MRFRSLSSARFLLLTTVTAVGCGLAACSDDDDGGGSTPMGPPSLEIVGFRNSNGAAFAADDSPVIVCTDGKLAVLIGPSENADGLLDNWFLRPPGACASAKQCGYVVTTVTSEDGSKSVSTAAASTTIPVDLTELSLDETGLVLAGEYELRVELHQGKTGDAFLVDDTPVADEVTLSFEVGPCAGPGAGGGGGAGGAGPGGAGPGGMGGLGGFGGAGGAL